MPATALKTGAATLSAAASLCFLALVFRPASGLAQDFDVTFFMAPDPRIWVGEIAYDRAGSADLNEEVTSGGKTGNHSRNREVREEMAIGACGEAGSLHVTSAERSLQDDTGGKSFLQAHSAECGSPRDIRHPGSSSRTEEKTEVRLHKWIGMPTEEESTSVYLDLQPGGGYRLTVVNRMLAVTTSDQTIREKDACTGKEKRSETHVRPGEVGRPPSFSTTGGAGEDSTALWETRPPAPLEAGFSAMGRVEGDLLQGNTLVSEIRPRRKGEYGERVTASWLFKAKDPCPEAYDALQWDLATAEAYADEGLQEKAFEVDDYDRAVAHRAREIATNAPRGSFGGTESPDPDIGTDMKCEIRNEEKHQDDVAGQCKPSVIFRKDLAHEKAHVAQCKDSHERFVKGRSDPPVYGRLETEAYVRGVEVLLDWLEQNRKYCPESSYPTAGFRRRLDRIKPR